MVQARACGLGVLMALMLTGCASGIKVQRLDGQEAAVTGNPWNLAMTQFEITITRHIVQCGGEIKGRSEVLAVPRAVLDEDQRYVLVSNGWWATSDITSNLAASGVSTGLNAQSADRTPAVIANLIGTTAQIAISAASPLKSKPPGQAEGCTAEVAAAVARLYPPHASKEPGLRKVVENRTAELAQATAKVALLTAQAQLDKASYAKPLVAALDEQERTRQQLARDQQALEAQLKLTTSTQSIRWPNRSADFHTATPYGLDEVSLSKWFVPFDDPQQLKDARAQFDVYFRIYERQRSDGRWTAPKAPAVADVNEGVPVRLARVGRLLTCFKQDCPATADESPPPEDSGRTATDQVILQLGQVYVVPLTGGTFKAENAVVAMDANGLPTSIQVVEKSAAAEALAGTLKDTATQLAALPGQVRATELAKTKDRTEQLTAEAALAVAQANAAVVDQTSPLAARTALLNAQAAQVNAATALAKAQLQLP